MRLFARRQPDLSCRQAVALITDYLEDTLLPPDRARVDRHLATCPHCGRYLAQLRATIAAAGRIDADALDEPTRQELLALFRSTR